MTCAAALATLVILWGGSSRAADPAPVQLELRDGVVSPQILEVPAGVPFQLEVRNTGRTPAEFESKGLKQERVLAPGARVVLAIGPLPAGRYPFVDEFRERLATARGAVVAK